MGSMISHSLCPAPFCVFAQKRIPLCPEMSSGQVLSKAALRGALKNSKLLSESCFVALTFFFFFLILQTNFFANRAK